MTRNLLFTLLFLISVFNLAPIKAWAQKKLVILGDSITEGQGVSKESAFPFLLEQKIKAAGKNWFVVNAGISGSTTASAAGRLKWMLQSQKPDLLILILGANDGLRGLKVQESKKNLSKVIEILQKEKVKVILGGIYMPPNYGKEYTTSFQKVFTDLAKEFKIPLIPFILKDVAGNSKYNQADGIHPNEEGHKIIATTIYTALKDQL